MLFHSMVFNERIIARAFADEMTSFFSTVLVDAVEAPYEDVPLAFVRQEVFPMLMCRLEFLPIFFLFCFVCFVRLFFCCYFCCWFWRKCAIINHQMEQELEQRRGEGGYSMTVRSQQSEEISGKIIHYVRLAQLYRHCVHCLMAFSEPCTFQIGIQSGRKCSHTDNLWRFQL